MAILLIHVRRKLLCFQTNPPVFCVFSNTGWVSFDIALNCFKRPGFFFAFKRRTGRILWNCGDGRSFQFQLRARHYERCLHSNSHHNELFCLFLMFWTPLCNATVSHVSFVSSIGINFQFF